MVSTRLRFQVESRVLRDTVSALRWPDFCLTECGPASFHSLAQQYHLFFHLFVCLFYLTFIYPDRLSVKYSLDATAVTYCISRNMTFATSSQTTVPRSHHFYSAMFQQQMSNVEKHIFLAANDYVFASTVKRVEISAIIYFKFSAQTAWEEMATERMFDNDNSYCFVGLMKLLKKKN